MGDHSMTASEFNELALRILAAFGHSVPGKVRAYDDNVIRIWEQNDDLAHLKTYCLDVMSKAHRGVDRPDTYLIIFARKHSDDLHFNAMPSIIEHMQRLVLLDLVAGL